MTTDATPSDAPADPFSPGDMRPLVAQPRSNRGLWLFGAGLALGGVLLFQALEARRAEVTAPAITAPQGDDNGVAAPPPSLVIPPAPTNAPPPYGWVDPNAPPVLLQRVPGSQPAPSQAPVAPRAPVATMPYSPPAYGSRGPGEGGLTSPGGAPGSSLGPTPGVGQAGQGPWSPQALPSRDAAERQANAADAKERVKASRFANPATTVPKGTVVQAVLEIGAQFDPRRLCPGAGFARYLFVRWHARADPARQPDHRRVQVRRRPGPEAHPHPVAAADAPDGVMIDLNSPSADPLGRAGTGGKVNNHFFERFSGAILQTSLNIGTQLAARAATHDTVILALPGSISQAAQVVQPDKIAPTVTVRQGSSVSVFVARDLDFTDVGS